LPLPDMVYAAATGDQLACRRLLGNVGKNAIGTPTRFGNMNRLMLVLALGSLGANSPFQSCEIGWDLSHLLALIMRILPTTLLTNGHGSSIWCKC